jgi:hypothetical protein
MMQWLSAMRAALVDFWYGTGVSSKPLRTTPPDSKTSALLSSIILPAPPPPIPLLPEFDFKPSDDFMAALGEKAVFVVANPLDLMLQGQNLMANVLVVEVSGPNTAHTVLWLRFDAAALTARGVAVCRMFIDPDERVCSSGFSTPLEWVGVCGWVMDRKRL